MGNKGSVHGEKHNFSTEISQERDYFGNLGVDEKKILKWCSQRTDCEDEMD